MKRIRGLGVTAAADAASQKFWPAFNNTGLSGNPVCVVAAGAAGRNSGLLTNGLYVALQFVDEDFELCERCEQLFAIDFDV